MSGVKLGGRESDLTIPECGLAIMLQNPNKGKDIHRYIQITVLYTPALDPIGWDRTGGTSAVRHTHSSAATSALPSPLIACI